MEAWVEVKTNDGGTRSVAIVDEHIEKSIRHACGISEITSAKTSVS